MHLNTYLRILIITLFGMSCSSVPFKQIDALANENTSQVFAKLYVKEQAAAPVKQLETLTDSYLREITGSKTYKTLASEQVVLSIYSFPEHWKNEPLFTLDNARLKKSLKLKNSKLSFNQLQAHESTLLQPNYIIEQNQLNEEALAALMVLSKQYLLFKELLHLNSFPILIPNTKPEGKWTAPEELDYKSENQIYAKQSFEACISALRSQNSTEALKHLQDFQDQQLKAIGQAHPSNFRAVSEYLINAYKPFGALGRIYLTFGLSMIVMSLLKFTKGRNLKKYTRIAFIHLLAFSALHFIFYILRLIALQKSPFNSPYEVLLCLSFISVWYGLFFIKRTVFVLGASSIFAGFVMLLANSYSDHHFFQIDMNASSVLHQIQGFTFIVGFASIGVNALKGILSNFVLFFIQENNKSTIIENIRVHIKIAQKINRIAIYCLSAGVFFNIAAEMGNGSTSMAYEAIRIWAIVLLVFCFGYILISKMNCAMPNIFQAVILLATSLSYYYLCKAFNPLHFIGEGNLLVFFQVAQCILIALIALFMVNAMKWKTIISSEAH